VPVIEPENREVTQLQGVHLFHAAFSNCSQRVRLVLEEKQIPWESHEIDLMALEHLAEDYQKLHPKGVVPALVHDGVVVVESNDIMRYLDERFDGKPLMPQTDDEKAAIQPWLQLNADMQVFLKTLTYERVLGKQHPPTQEKFEFYRQHQRNRDLVEFWRQFLEGFTPERLAECEQECRNFLSRLNQRLDSRPYLAGDDISLADFSTVVNVHRTHVLGFDLAEYPHVSRWYESMRRRPSFEQAILAYAPG